MTDHRPTEVYRPKSIESALACITYKHQMAELIDVQIYFMSELMEDICTRLKALEAAAHD